LPYCRTAFRRGPLKTLRVRSAVVLHGTVEATVRRGGNNGGFFGGN
jgi:hypothetical protein